MIIEQLLNNDKFIKYIQTKRIKISKKDSIKEWTQSFKLNDKFYNIVFICYDDIENQNDVEGNIDNLKDIIVQYFCNKKKYTNEQYQTIKNLFSILNDEMIAIGTNTHMKLLIGASLDEVFNSLLQLVDQQETDAQPSLESESVVNTNTTKEDFESEFSDDEIPPSDYPGKIKDPLVKSKLTEVRADKQPYKTKKQQKADIDIYVSEENKIKIIKALESKVNNELGQCIENVRGLSNNYKDIFHNVVSKLNFGLLGSLVFNQINAFIEGDQPEILCSAEKLKEFLLCPVLTDPWNFPDLSSKNGPDFSIPFDISDLIDFFKKIRKIIDDLIVQFIIRIITELLDLMFNILDCNDINKFIIKCKNTIDLRYNSYLDDVKMSDYFNKSADETYLDIQNSLDKYDIKIDLQDYLQISKNIFESFTVNQLQSLSNGIFSGQIFRLVKNIIQTVLGDKVSEDKYVGIIKTLEETTDSTLLDDNINATHDECIHFMPYVLMKDKLLKQGYTNEQAEQKVEQEKQTKVESGKLVCKLLRGELDSFNNEELFNLKSDITRYTIEKSIDHIFDGIGKHQYKYIESILSNILLNTFGDMCVASYSISSSETNTLIEQINKNSEVEKRFLNELTPTPVVDFNNFNIQTFGVKGYNLNVEKQSVELQINLDYLSFGENTSNNFYYKTYRNVSYFKDFDGKEYFTNIIPVDIGFNNLNSLNNYFIDRLNSFEEDNSELISGIKASKVTNIEIFNDLYFRYKKEKYSDLFSSYFLQEILENKSDVKTTVKYVTSKLDFFQVELARQQSKDILLRG